MFGGFVASQLVGVDLEQRLQRDGHRLRLEQRGLRARFGRALRRIGRYRAVAQPGQGGRRRPGLPEPALVAEEEQLRVLDVVAPLDADTGGQQPRIDLRGGAPHPAADMRPGPDGPGEVRFFQDRTRGQPVGAEGDEACPTALRSRQSPPFAHECECGTRV